MVYCRSCNREFEPSGTFDESYLENRSIKTDRGPAVIQHLHPKIDCDED